ncbi:hypothetical protein [Pedobacter psychroterrae]|uniref:Uncharacterized protein n=1 Tax=Pedobacter psychroterrae TaxID=2530453 RepID=A0A4R0NH94_9SPHI|nr:hypothetical protein [Pedobacter psychroterrae]TCC99941.1 hypothetical protein EZ437_17025 [Pedobacter psychroterrae]
MKKALFSIFMILLYFSEVRSQERPTEEKYRKIWSYILDTNKLEFNMPENFSTIIMKDCNYGIWDCKNGQKYAFQHVLINSDSTIAVGIRIDFNYTWANSKGEAMSTNVDWLQNAEDLYKFRVDLKKEYQDLDNQLLKRHWNAAYGMKFSRRRCDTPFIKDYSNHKSVVIANKDIQILFDYFYNNEFNSKVDGVIDSTITMLRKK